MRSLGEERNPDVMNPVPCTFLELGVSQPRNFVQGTRTIPPDLDSFLAALVVGRDGHPASARTGAPFAESSCCWSAKIEL